MSKKETVEVPVEELRALMDNAELGFAGGNEIVTNAIAVLRPLTGSASIFSEEWTPINHRRVQH